MKRGHDFVGRRRGDRNEGGNTAHTEKSLQEISGVPSYGKRKLNKETRESLKRDEKN